MRAILQLGETRSHPDRVDPLSRYRLAVLLGLMIASWVVTLGVVWLIWRSWS